MVVDWRINATHLTAGYFIRLQGSEALRKFREVDVLRHDRVSIDVDHIQVPQRDVVPRVFTTPPQCLVLFCKPPIDPCEQCRP